MMHHIPFDSKLKSEPPPHLGENRYLKKVKLGDMNTADTMMETDYQTATPEMEIHVSATTSTELVPKTQLAAEESKEAYQSNMNIDKETHKMSAMSFKDTLLNHIMVEEGEEEDDLDLQQGDVTIGMEGNIPTVNFAEHVLQNPKQEDGFCSGHQITGQIYQSSTAPTATDASMETHRKIPANRPT